MQGPPTSRITPATRSLRVDLQHGGSRASEWMRVEDVNREGIWSGARARPREPTSLGDYRACVYEVGSGELLFTCGLSSFFDEWRSTRSTDSVEERSFSESIRIPQPAMEVRFVVEARDARGLFDPLLDTVIHPRDVRGAGPDPSPDVIDVSIAGDAAACVNVLFVAEGYLESERDKFRRDAERFSRLLLSVEPYRSKRFLINVRALFLASKESGISDPTRNRSRETFLKASYDVFGIARYMLTFENRKLRQAAAAVPYDCLIVLCNCDTYGGGGVFNQYACIAADAPHASYLVTHELGHSFAGLADEYYTSQVTYDVSPPACEPWNPNVTIDCDRRRLKWGRLVDPDVPLPTPWEQRRYDELAAQARSASERLGMESEEVRQLGDEMKRLLEQDPHYARVGAFEGALYRASGTFRPEIDCLMFSRSHARFCRVCHDAIAERLTELTRPG